MPVGILRRWELGGTASTMLRKSYNRWKGFNVLSTVTILDLECGLRHKNRTID